MRKSERNQNRGNHIHLDVELLSAYIDGEVTPEEAARVEQHLPACQRCSEELESLRWTVNLLREAPPVAVPRSFAIRPVDLAPEPARRRFVLPDWLFRGLQWATVATAVLTILVFAADFLHVGQPAGAPLNFRAMQQPAPSPAERAAEPEQPVESVVEKPEAEKKVVPLIATAPRLERDNTVELAGGPAAEPVQTRIASAPYPGLSSRPLIGVTEVPPATTPRPGPGMQGQIPAAPAEVTVQIAEAPQATPVPEPGERERVAALPRSRDWLRVAGSGLAGLFVILLGLTLWARRQRG